MLYQIFRITGQPSEDYLVQLAGLEAQLFFDDNWHKTAWQDLLSQDYNHCFLLIHDEKILAYCLVQIMFDTAEILRIGVHPNQQQQGFAKQLLNEVIIFLQQVKIEKILLEVRRDNIPAIGLYQSFGFEQIHIRKNYYKNKDGSATDANILQKII